MKTANYRGILYFILLTIIITIGVQIYWNYKNYQLNKQRVFNEIQLSLDNALEEYYANIAKTDFFTIIKTKGTFKENADVENAFVDSLNNSDLFINGRKTKSEIQVIVNNSQFSKRDSLKPNEHVDFLQKFSKDTNYHYPRFRGFKQLNTREEKEVIAKINGTFETQVIKDNYANYDSLNILNHLGSILLSFQRDILNYPQIDSLLTIQLTQKNIQLDYKIIHLKNDTIFYQSPHQLTGQEILTAKAKSTYIKPQEQLTLHYKNPIYVALKRSFLGIFISFFLALAIISCLFYLLKIIKQQKQLAEIKNDLISNITHEFKTPIATIGVAVESIKDFNVLDDKVKTKSYLDISTKQLSKLNTMVEKLLETATLDSEGLQLQLEEVNLYELLEDLIRRYKLQGHAKHIHFNAYRSAQRTIVDPFHIENAINNLIDNAMKYGGDQITITLVESINKTKITISDNGHSLTSAHKNEIFEKFYRVPSGNRHDVKGFGIGLYYTKKIVQKHGGSIELTLHKKSTDFNITLPRHG
ncbi:HAMP domain-containing histidine kinase [Flavobacteriaceae bacterium F08102]|nr:HAMP domain-containing histidine kinase [Flavobacteriaceae bacterium F08102]